MDGGQIPSASPTHGVCVGSRLSCSLGHSVGMGVGQPTALPPPPQSLGFPTLLSAAGRGCSQGWGTPPAIAIGPLGKQPVGWGGTAQPWGRCTHWGSEQLSLIPGLASHTSAPRDACSEPSCYNVMRWHRPQHSQQHRSSVAGVGTEVQSNGAAAPVQPAPRRWRRPRRSPRSSHKQPDWHQEQTEPWGGRGEGTALTHPPCPVPPGQPHLQSLMLLPILLTA